jgi:hypothetical protein
MMMATPHRITHERVCFAKRAEIDFKCARRDNIVRILGSFEDDVPPSLKVARRPLAVGDTVIFTENGSNDSHL